MPSWVILAVCLALTFGGCLDVAGAHAAASKETCGTDGASPSTITPSDAASAVDQSFSWWPLGRRCTRSDAGHSETVVSGGFVSTLVAYGLLVIGVAGVLWVATRPTDSE